MTAFARLISSQPDLTVKNIHIRRMLLNFDLPGKDYPAYIELVYDQDRIQCSHSHSAVP